ncbi:unannotated protein [freshwater metagenome]|uniref:Unannotated protein n=1 Tax=freshwater metagenome TaxID=449393 RepID=A0A6J6RYZ4_9ZZZZ|nr:hypothetical protein [Actinomycetota bacterium]
MSERDRFDVLAERLGPTVTAFLSCAQDATGRGADPERLGAARAAWAEITRTHSDDVARNWFIAANHRLSGAAPEERLREGHTKSVMSAARGFAAGEVMGA